METLPAIKEEAPFDPKELASYIKGAPDIYQDITERAHRAIDAGDKLIAKALADGVDETLATKMVDYIKKAKSTKELSSQKRKPITQMFDVVKKAFTSIEAGIQDKADHVKKLLDQYAAEQAKIQREKEEAARKEAAKKQEYGEVEAEVQKGLLVIFNDLLLKKKTYLTSIVEYANLPGMDSVQNELKNYSEELDAKELKWPKINPVHITDDDVKDIKKAAWASLSTKLKLTYKSEIEDIKKELQDKIPSKIAELKEMEQASAAKKKKLESEAKKRREEEDAKLKAEAEEAKKKAEDEAKAKAESAAMNAQFDAVQAASESAVPKGKVSYEITVTHQQAYAEMFAMWFAKEGGKMEMDKLEKVTLGRIKAYFEKLATDGEKFESKYIKFKENYNVSTRR